MCGGGVAVAGTAEGAWEGRGGQWVVRGGPWGDVEASGGRVGARGGVPCLLKTRIITIFHYFVGGRVEGARGGAGSFLNIKTSI